MHVFQIISKRTSLFLFFPLLFLAVTLLPSPAFAKIDANHLVRVGIFPLEPLNFIDEDGKAQGLYPDLIRKIVRDRSWDIEFVLGSWAENMDRLQTGEIDIITTIAHTAERAGKIDYSMESVVDIWGQIFINPAEKINTVLDLQNKKVGLMRKDINGKNFQEIIKKFNVTCQIIEFATHDEIFTAIKNHTINAGVAPQHFGFLHAKSYGIVGTSIQFAPFSTYFAAKKGKQHDLLRHIDSQLSRWKNDKNSYYYDRISFWMGGKKFQKEIVPIWLILIVTITGCAAALFFLLNRTLKIKVKEKTKALSTREKEYRDLVEGANSVILRMDKNGTILFMNKYGLDLFGYEQKELLGKSVRGTIVPEKETGERNLYDLVLGIIKHPEDYELNENVNICKDGKKVQIQWSNRAIFDEDGRFKEILSVGTDISKRKELESDLIQAQKLEAVGTLAGGIAHDFNNILAVIVGYTELALLHKEKPEKLQEELQMVLESSERAKHLVQQILSFSRKRQNVKQPLQLSTLVKESVKMLQSTIPSTIQIQHHVTTDSSILADPTKMHQVIMNLCTNSYHAMMPDGGKLDVSLSDFEKQNGLTDPIFDKFSQKKYVHLEVRDTGCGIKPEILPKIFEPYFTTKETGKGTGLGLSVVHGVVDDHNGHITVDTEPGEGTSFHIYFPVVEKESPDAAQNSELQVLEKGNEKVLVVDDDPQINSLVETILQNFGYQVTGFTQSLVALETFRKNPDDFDLLITDMTMPEMTGAQLAEKVLQINPKFPIILCTGYSEIINEEEAKEIGIVSYLKKPVSQKTLLGTVRKALDKGKV